jgi:hypothetical protein
LLLKPRVSMLTGRRVTLNHYGAATLAAESTHSLCASLTSLMLTFGQAPQDTSNNSNTEARVVIFRRPSDSASAAAHQVNDQDHQGND